MSTYPQEYANLKDLTQPKEVDQVLFAFPAHAKWLMPEYKEIPKDYPGCEVFTRLQQDWFFKGLPDNVFEKVRPKLGIDEIKAWRHLGCIQKSFEPKHEHKVAAVAYLLSLWFEVPTDL